MLQNLRVRDRFILGKVNEDLEDRPYGMKSFSRCAGILGKSAANRNLAGNGLRGDRSACGIRQIYISQKKNSGPLHFGSLASRGAYAPETTFPNLDIPLRLKSGFGGCILQQRPPIASFQIVTVSLAIVSART